VRKKGEEAMIRETTVIAIQKRGRWTSVDKDALGSKVAMRGLTMKESKGRVITFSGFVDLCMLQCLLGIKRFSILRST